MRHVSGYNNKGLALIEIMVAMVIGVILALGILNLLVNVTSAYRVQNAIKTLDENGQFAIEHLTRDIRDAGFWGCTSTSDDITNNLLSSSSVKYHEFSNAIEGTQSDIGGGQDTITLRGVDNIREGMHIQAPYPTTNSDPIQIASNSGVSVGNIVLVGDCEQGDIFQVTNSDAIKTGTLEHIMGSGTLGNRSGTLSKVYSGDAFAFLPYTHIYDIQNGTNGKPALFRTTANGSQELIDNVESMIVLYGEDLTDNGTANRYVRANSVSDMTNVVSVRVEILLASEENNLNQSFQPYYFNKQTITPTDKKLRRVYSRTIVLKNRTS